MLLTLDSPVALKVSKPASPQWLALGGLCLLLAIAQVALAGYSFGVGNQSIQVPLLQRAIDGATGDGRLYTRDAMVTTTAGEYPSYFFRLLAAPARWIGVAPIYRGLHLITAFGVFLAICALSRSIFDDTAAGLLTAVLLLAGHHHALAGDTLYSPGFTHTFAVFPLAIAAIALAFRRRYALALLLTGAMFNLHALTAGYVLVLVLAAWASEEEGLRAPLMRAWLWLILGLLLFLAAASPTIRLMLAHRQAFDAQWTALTRIRSADHSFPSTWWQPGSSELPRFALIAGLFALSLSFVPGGRQRRQSLAMLTAAGALGLIGYVLSDLYPVPVVLRAQLFRMSRLVMVIFLVHIAYAAIAACRIAWQRGRDARAARSGPELFWFAIAEVASAALTVASLAIPALLPLLPLAFAIAIVVSLVNARLSTWQAVAVGAVTIAIAAAWRDTGFALSPAVDAMSIHGAGTSLGAVTVALLIAVGGARMMRERKQAWLRWGGCAVIAGSATFLLYRARTRAVVDPWTGVQRWARSHTKEDALFLTPIQPGGFRLESERAVVGEWRDGTQLYFSSQFAPTWWQRMNDLQPGLLMDASGKRLLSRGRSLDSMDDEAIVALAGRYGATHIVLPTGGNRSLARVYSNDGYAVYLPQIPQPEAPADVTDRTRWDADEKFIRDTVLPNIEKNRKGDMRLQLLDTDGRPLAGASVEVRQVRQTFDFSASLPFFGQADMRSANGDYQPPPVEPRELERFLEVFNYSMIPFSSKWMYVEPFEGERHYEELDRYISWCTEHHIGMEYHFVSGYFAPWVARKDPQQQGAAFVRHARQLAERYGDKIDAWQVVNESILLQQSPPVFKELRKVLPPGAKLGISDCAKFAPENRGAITSSLRRLDMYRGLETIKWLKSQGVQVDFFGFHGHRPFGLWPEARVMYDVIDKYAAEGVRLNITEVTVPNETGLLGNLRSGRFTAEVQADYYERLLTILYSHPAVDMVNLWGIGPNTWQDGSGLLDKDYNPKPAFAALKKLITETWRTNTALKLGLDGAASFRGFHGDYEGIVKLPGGQTAKVTFRIEPGRPDNSVRLRLDAGNAFSS